MPFDPQAASRGRKAPERSAHERYAELLGLIYEGAEEEQPWSRALEQIRAELDASWVALLLRPATEQAPARLLTAGGPLWLAQDSPYESGGRCPPGHPFTDLPCDRMLPVPDFSPSRAAPPQVIGADLLLGQGLRVRLRICRGGRQPAFGAAELRWGEDLLPHFRRALLAWLREQTRTQETQLLARALESLKLGVVILDESGTVLRSNAAAETILRRKDGLRLVNAGLSCTAPAEDRRLRGAIRSALQRHAASGEGIAVAATRDDGCSRVGLLVQALPPGPLDGGRRPAVAVFLRDPHGECHPAPGVVAQLFGLTPVETRLALEMTNGATLDETAALLDIRRNTARTHLRSIFAKIGVQRQAALVRVILNSVAVLS